MSREEQQTLVRVLTPRLAGQLPDAVELARIQRVSPVRDVAELKADFWPDDESVDDFIAYTDRQRREDRAF